MRKFPGIMVAVLALVSGSGCRPEIRDGGEDFNLLKEPTDNKPGVVSAQRLLPLAVGNYWDMNVTSQHQSVTERMIVTGPVRIGNEAGVQVNIVRAGRPWRVEVYQNDKKGLLLLAFGQSPSTLLVLNPPFPISLPEVKEATALTWKGKITLQGKSYLATGYSRVTSKDTVTTDMGRHQAYRLDSVVTMQSSEEPLHFPNVRWLAPDIGFLRRGYADNGDPAVSEMQRYMTGGPPG